MMCSVSARVTEVAARHSTHPRAVSSTSRVAALPHPHRCPPCLFYNTTTTTSTRRQVATRVITDVLSGEKVDVGKWRYTRESEESGDYTTLRTAVKVAVREGCRDPETWRSYSSQIQEASPSLSAEDACFFLSAFANGKVQDLNLTTALCQRLQDLGPWDQEIAASELKKLIIAFGRSKVFDSDLMRSLVPTLIDRVEEFRAPDVAHILYAYSRIPLADGNLFSLAASVLPAYVYDLRPNEMAHVAEAFANVSMYDEALFDALTQEASRRLRDFNGQDCLVFFDSLSLLTSRLKQQHGHEDFPGLHLRDDSALWDQFVSHVTHCLGNYAFLDLLRVLILLQRIDKYENRLIHNRLLPLMLTQLHRSDQVGFQPLGSTLQGIARLPWQSEVSVELCYELCKRLSQAPRPKDNVVEVYLMVISTLEALKVDPETRNAALGDPLKGVKEEQRALLLAKLEKMEDPPKRWMESLKNRREKV